MILVDAHVHIYDCFDLERFFDAAMRNFQSAARLIENGRDQFSFFLLLTEGAKQNWFQLISDKVAVLGSIHCGKWIIYPSEERITLIAENNSSSGQLIYLVAGRQIVTAERLEVLALFSDQFFEDGKPLNNTVEVVKKNGAIPVIPWGAGKWFGKRGNVLKKYLGLYRGKDLFLGDNGGRPGFWPTPSLFRQAKLTGLRILPGSDPLPFSSEQMKPGSTGCTLTGSIDAFCPAKSLKKMIVDPETQISVYRKQETTLRFFRNQIAMQIVKRQR
jgi:hypothetical protein